MSSIHSSHSHNKSKSYPSHPSGKKRKRSEDDSILSPAIHTISSSSSSSVQPPSRVSAIEDLDGNFDVTNTIASDNESDDNSLALASVDNDNEGEEAPSVTIHTNNHLQQQQQQKEKKRKQIENLQLKQKNEKSKQRQSLSLPIHGESGSSIASNFWKQYLSSNASESISSLELSSGTIQPDDILVLTPSKQEDTETVSLPVAIKQALPNWKNIFGWRHGMAPRPKGCPALVIVCSSARRCADLLKPLSVFNTRIGKCFAKHLNIKEQQEMIYNGPPITIAIGTPNRLHKLFELDILKNHLIESVVWDMQPDPKGFTILDSFATRNDSFLLFHQHVLPRIASKNNQSSNSSSSSTNSKSIGIRMSFYV